MDQGKRLEALLKIQDGLKETLQTAIDRNEVSPQSRSEALSRLASIQREIESLKRSFFGADVGEARDLRSDTDDWPEFT
jgi:hypothetical protein